MRSRRWFLAALAACGAALGCSPSPDASDTVVVTARRGATGPRVLVVVAHPDDEIAFAGTLYKTTTHLDGVVDLVTITNGEGGFKYATLAERTYGLELTREEVGRRHLPAIRRRELIDGCRGLFVHTITFLGQRDHRYTRDPDEVLASDAGVWDLALVRDELERRLRTGDYDFVLGLAPTAETHGHHQAASILAAEAVATLPVEERPTLLVARHRRGDDPPPTLVANEHAPELTAVVEHPPLVFDRAQRFGHAERLDYSIVANQAIVAHRTQGTMQLLVGPAGEEHYFCLAPSPPDGPDLAAAWFERLREPQFRVPDYGESAGTNAR